jgi:hypothetical protein
VTILGPERLQGQGLDPHQYESGDRAILALLSDPEVRDQVDLVITWRAGAAPAEGAYEVWARRGMVRFRRVLHQDGSIAYPVVEVVGENPVADQDPHALRSVAEECRAARAGGFAAEDPARRFIAPEQQSYPFAYERIAQLFDSPNAPDLVISPKDWCFGIQAGTHGALHVRQARAPLWLAGRRVRAGVHDLAARQVDIAPTLLAALDFPHVDGADASGRRASERGVPADVYLRRQDGRVLEEVLEFGAKPPNRLYVLILDGIHSTTLEERLEQHPEGLPHLRRLRDRAAVLASGSIVNFPSITWPSHTTLGTGAWCGHHDVVNPSYYLRDKRETVSPQGQQVRTEGFVGAQVETLYEAFHRVQGSDALTASIHEPLGRGADHAVLEGRNLGHRPRLKALTREFAVDCDSRWEKEGFDAVARESVLDNRGVAQAVELFTRDDLPPPSLVVHELALTDGAGHDYGPHHEGLHAALEESDRRIGRILELLEACGLLDETLIVVTADHGMAPQDVSLRANPTRHVQRIGMQGVVSAPMIWLRDLRVEVERAADGRTGRVLVADNDALPNGERPPVEGAQVRLEAHGPDVDGRPQALVAGRTDAGGIFGFATPAEIASAHLAVVIRAEGFNPRRLLLDGHSLRTDLRAALYGDPRREP